MSYIDASDLAGFTALVAEAADSQIDWYPATLGTEVHGDPSFPSQPRNLQAVVLDGTMELHNAQGYQRIRTRDFYFPGNPAIGPTDRLVLAGENPRSSSPILRVEPLPTAGTTVATRVRTGRA